MKPLESISVFGLGKLGACIAATLAARGFRVTGIDIDPEKVARVNRAEPPVEEPLLADTLASGRERLRAATRADEAADTDASFFIPPSPSLPDGSFSNEFLLRAMQSMARVVREKGKKGHLFVVNSTTTPGAVNGVLVPMLEKEIGGRCGTDFGICYNPEFIALGNVIQGLQAPDLVLIGESDAGSGARLEALYRRYLTNQAPIKRMSIASAELTKISINSYITMKISFTNQLRLIAERLPGADIHEVLDAIGTDSRIGKKYLRAGMSYGGPCFPRDNRLLAHAAREVGLEAPLAEASDRVNERVKQELAGELHRTVPKDQVIAILGMAYKPDTPIVEESAGLYLAQKLKHLGHRIVVHDVLAHPSNSPALFEFERIDPLSDLGRIEKLGAVVIACPWPDYKQLQLPASVRVVDPWGITEK